ncbi:hemin ABC transporter substrate-binding protein [Nocardioides sp. Arc9.136]|uniref:heme/hemin ABC transporter substrate-binding protein n=1 Tax=Nocardioides sp. Arc9.136 TaxID=2996826 RepID=UPI002666EBF4|nr:ABC transporter substrate-binding protein [Nocardioides sp. Arc9.136]WKN47686.1 ABC transporter substrate-binding protein [Nocardioides sp. Arc9.136]
MLPPSSSVRLLVPSIAGLVVALLLAGCGISTGERAVGSDADPSALRTAPPLADVEPLEDVRAWDGEAVVAADDAIDPVAEAPEQHLPVTLTDAQGTEVRVEDASRVLALDVHGTLARTVAELGLADVLVGRDVSTQVAGLDDLPLVTQDGHDLVAEAILELDPTLVVTDTSLGPWDVVLQVRDAGIPVVVLEPERTLENVGGLVHGVAEALGVPEEGAALAERTRREIDAVTAEVARVAPADEGERLRMVFLYVRGQSGVYYMFGEGSGADSLIDAIGGYDVAEEIGWNGMKPLTDEGLVAAQPDLVLMMSGGLESAGGVDGLLERLPALAETPAGRHRRFVAMDDAAVLGFGPATASVLEALTVAAYAPGELS